MKKTFRKTSVAALAGSLISAGVAFAAPPANVEGVWMLLSGQVAEELNITTQYPYPAGTCQRIVGTVRGIAPVHGIYCPQTGRIQIVHENVATKHTVRVYTGNLADEVTGQPSRMAGSFTVLYETFGTFGEYGFSASR